MNEDLKAFVKQGLERELSRDDLGQALSDAGWRRDEIDAVLASYADPVSGLAVPRPRPYLSAKEAFIYLLMFLCLYLSAWSFGAILFYFINLGLPDPTQLYHEPSVRQLRMSLAMLIVAFPIYFWLTSLTAKAVRRDPDKRSSKIRKWLTYITLFVAAGVIIGDLISLLFNLLGGDTTTRFLLKTLVVLLIASLIFGYYLWDLRKEE
jgi:hypothetical protein